MIRKILDKISDLDEKAALKVKNKLNNLTKPIGSLGMLEDIIIQLAGIYKSDVFEISKKCTVIMCADNGITDEGVSSCPKSVTYSVTNNFMRGITGVNVFSNLAGSDIKVVDIGVDGKFTHPEIVNKKIMYGTNNMLYGSAMSRSQAEDAIIAGFDVAKELIKSGYTVLGTGEMGIGNTSTSTAVLSVLADVEAEIVAGVGSGLSKEQFDHKKAVIRKAIQVNVPDKSDVIDVLSKVGGLDIAGLIGVILCGAAMRVPVVIDGFIAGVAAFCAVSLEPKVREYLIPSHCSAEPGAALINEKLKFKPPLNLDMRVGEGTGAVLMYMMLDAAFAAYTKMGTFDDAEIKSYSNLHYHRL